ncbi:aminotransferase class V-fold PLP-dependent enzyme [Crassaminicella thermophila]|uniref:cysteine desulfurase n=1 Tax=Crassaminicella thermophila TaxID=2599308 RepID=A0A5C0SC88_CRATE|nr:aminotransferase class V-fold PLP-dependent enzyme [Crassaminicella thermophila]QEK11542.1 aminotransferase class V-fold PLP-dependent enzyme [Crassaminicella thermophila]
MDNIIYFDNAATTYPKPEEVYTFMDKYYREFGVNVGRGQYTTASKANKIVEETRELIRELFKCSIDKKVIFTPSATEAINIILQGINWQGEENVYITHFEHNAVLRLLYQLKEKYNIKINFLHTEKKPLFYDIEKIKHQFQDIKPDVVIMTHASNVCGLITPIKEITELAKVYNAQVAIDCAQTAGLLDIDMKKIDADYLIFAGHKTLYGPFGIAGFLMDERSTLKPLLYGGTGIDSANPNLPNTIPEKFEVGSLNVYAIAGLNAALKWINKIGRENIYKKEKEMTTSLITCLESFDNIRVITASDAEKQIGVVSCVFEGYGSDIIGQVFDQYNIAVRTGLHCAPEAHRFLGTFPGGTVRLSLGYFNSKEDITKLHNILEYIYLDS